MKKASKPKKISFNKKTAPNIVYIENLDPDFAESLEPYIKLEIENNHKEMALRRLEDRLAARPQSAPLWLVAGRSYFAIDRLDRAEMAFRRVIEIDPSSMPAYGALGRLYAKQQRLDDAVREFDAAATRQAGHLGAATMAAVIVHAQGKTVDATKRYESIIAANPRAAVAANNLAWIYAESGSNLSSALQLAQTAKSQLPELPEVNDTLGWVFYKQGLFTSAIPPLKESVAAVADNPVYRYHLGMAYLKAGEYRQAREALEHALKLSGTFEGAAEARKSLALIQG